MGGKTEPPLISRAPIKAISITGGLFVMGGVSYSPEEGEELRSEGGGAAAAAAGGAGGSWGAGGGWGAAGRGELGGKKRGDKKLTLNSLKTPNVDLRAFGDPKPPENPNPGGDPKC